MTRSSRPISARARILGAILAVAAIGLTIVGGVTFLVYVRAVDIGAQLDPVTAAVTTYWVAAIAVLAAIGVVGWFVAGRLLSPIRDLRDAADAITLVDLSPRLSPEGVGRTRSAQAGPRTRAEVSRAPAKAIRWA